VGCGTRCASPSRAPSSRCGGDTCRCRCTVGSSRIGDRLLWGPTLDPHGGNGTYAGAPTWQRVGVVLGVIFCFPFFFTIPGWLALRHRNKWKQGLVPLPKFLIFWGYLMSAVIVVAFVVSATAGGDSDRFTSVGFTSVWGPREPARRERAPPRTPRCRGARSRPR
jgi:hypothetical protein